MSTLTDITADKAAQTSEAARKAIVYGGRETSDKTGYIANKNLVGATPCSPCWEENKCDYDRECMKMISVEAVAGAALEQIDRHGSPLETEVVNL